MNPRLDNDGQPTSGHFNKARRITRGIHELIGLLRGIAADGYVSSAESDTLAKWLVANREIEKEWPVTTLVERMNRIYADGVADEDERADLLILVNEIIGRQDDDTFLFTPTDLPFTKPEPEVVFDLNEFVFTGRFLYGSRKACQREVEQRGGRCADNVLLQTSYLVIGSLMSRDWKFSTHGNKISKAVEYTGRCPIAIIHERHWESYLRDGKPLRSAAGS